MLLTNIMPVSTRLATRLPRASSRVKTDPPRPKSESLANSIAAASSLTRKKDTTGPKNSSRKAGLSGLISVSIVVSIYDPGRSMRLPPRSSFAPSATASCTCLRSCTNAASVDRGPCVVFSSIGSPGFKTDSAAVNFSINASAIESTTIKRFAAQQVCPPLYMRPHTAHAMVLSRSASSSTMNASLPPNSIDVFLRFCPARAATSLPAATLPVSATPLMRGSSITRSACWWVISKLV